MITTEDERRNLLWSYMCTEPEIVVNAEHFTVSVDTSQRDMIYFYAVTIYGELAAKVALLRHCWNEITNGLTMAYMYNTILETLERVIDRNGGVWSRPYSFGTTTEMS